MLRTRVATTSWTLVLVSLLLSGGAAQMGEDPRNASEDYYDAIDNAKCMSCHDFQGMRPLVSSFAARYPQLPINETQDVIVQVRNPWRHSLQDVQVTLNTSQARNVQVMTGDQPAPLEENGHTAELRWDNHTESRPFNHTFPVHENATTVRAYAVVRDAPLGSTLGKEIDRPPRFGLSLLGPSEIARPAIATGDAFSKVARYDGEDIAKQGLGDWDLLLWYTSGLDDEITLEYGFSVWYNGTATEYTFYAGDVVLREGETTSFTMPLRITSPDEAFLDLRIQARAHYDHQAGSNAVDDGHFWRFLTMHTRGGDGAIALQGTTAPQITGFQVDLLNLFTRILGFASALLIPVAMVTGGLFGKRSRRAMNRWLGGARKRVLWHSAMSWAILLVATTHLALALLEAQFAWTKGLLWGGVGWVLLVSLGVTGYFQVRMIKRWDYRTWRHVHLWSAVGVFAFAGLHTVIDGTDLQAVRDLLPWLGRLSWP